MSTNLAVTLPARSPREQPQRRIEIVSTRAQRRARPKPLYAIIVVSGLFLVFMVQLLLSIVVSDGAYTISNLRAQEADLSRSAQSLTETVDVLASTQNLATQAEALGMVLSTTTPAFLDLSTGKVVGKSKSATGDLSATLGGDGSLVPNALLADADDADTASEGKADAAASDTPAVLTTVDPTATEQPDLGGIESGAPAVGATDPAVTSQSTLPTPVTR